MSDTEKKNHIKKQNKSEPIELNEMQFLFSASIDNKHFDIRSYTRGLISQEAIDERPYKHFFTEFHYIFQGTEEITFPMHGKKLTLSAGQFCIIPQGVYHGVITSPDVKRFCFNITGELFSEDVIGELIDSDFIRGVMEHCLEISASGNRLGVLLLDVVFELLDIVKQMSGNSKTERIKQEPAWIIEEYLLQHFRDSDGLPGLAAKLYLSERQTRNLCKKFYGQDYRSLILKHRMEFADILLRDTTRSMEKIAEEVGYWSYSGFYQAYVNYFGVSPSERRMNQNETCSEYGSETRQCQK